MIRDSLAPLQISGFRWQFLAQTISMMGSTLSPVALSMGVMRITGSSFALGAVLAASSIPTVVMLLIGGVWADRLPRHKLMAVCSLICALTQAGLASMLIMGRFHLGAAIVLQVLYGTAMAFFLPSSGGLTAQTVPKGMLQRANALLSLASSIAASIGPLVAGLLVVTAGAGWALAVDAGTFVVAAILLLCLRLAKEKPREQSLPFLAQLGEGFHEVTSRSWVWSSIAAFMVTHLATASLLVLGPVMMSQSDQGVLSWSLVVAGLGIGQAAGDLSALRLVPRRPIVVSRLVELLAVPLFVALALNAPVAVLVVAAVAAGYATTMPDALWFTALQQHLPPQVLSRVSSYDFMGSFTLRPIGLALAGAIGASAGGPLIFAIAAAALVGTRLAGLAIPGVWAVESLADETTT